MWKRILLLGAGGITTVIGGGFAYLSLRSPNLLPAEFIQVRMTIASIARGKYLFTVVADCDGCHRGRGRGWQFPKELGLPGEVVAPNITPDVETGIGAWTDGEKIRANREGIGRDGRALFFMMPYRNFARMSDDDVQSLVAYMNTLPAIRTPLPRTKLNFPVNYVIAGAKCRRRRSELQAGMGPLSGRVVRMRRLPCSGQRQAGRGQPAGGAAIEFHRDVVDGLLRIVE